jgi:hypothetical protein
MLPAADHFARAVVAACVLTKESPLAVAEERVQKSRARHYAFHAIRAVFPETPIEGLAFRVGCSGDPKWFARNTINGLTRFVGGPHAGKRHHRFWNETTFEKVIEAIKAVGPGVEVFEEPSDKIEEPVLESEPQDPAPVPPPAKAVEAEPRRFMSERQAKAYRMLQAAVINTAKLPSEG